MIYWLKKNWLLLILFLTLAALAGCYIFIAVWTDDGGVFAQFFGVKDKKTTLESVAVLMGGVSVVIGLVALNRRADAQVRNNELVERGHINERFKSAIESLGHAYSQVRIAAIYQLYYLAKDNPDAGFRKSVFEILCAYLRDMTRCESYRTGDGKKKLTEDCQSLLNVLFTPEDGSAFSEFHVKIWDIYLVGADFSNARMRNVSMAGADLRAAVFDSADLRDAFIVGANLRGARFVGAKLQYALMNNSKLHSANLGKANMRCSQISDAEFNGANLAYVNFRDAGMCGTDFSGAHLLNADFRGAALGGAIFRGAVSIETAKFDKGVMDLIREHGVVPDDYKPAAGGNEVVIIAKK